MLFTRWAFESLSVTAFEEARDGDDYLGLYSFDDHPAGFGNTWLLVWFISLQALILLGLSPPMYNMQFASEKDIEEKHAAASEAIEEINFNVNLEAGPAGASVAGGWWWWSCVRVLCQAQCRGAHPHQQHGLVRVPRGAKTPPAKALPVSAQAWVWALQ